MVLLAPMDSRADDFPIDEDASFAITPRHPVHPELRRLSALEQSVVALSLFDAVSTVRAPGFCQRFLSGVFGIEPANKLADKRLEALRRYCILARARSDGLEEREVMRGHGFSDEKMGEIGLLIARASSGRKIRSPEGVERM